MGKGITAQVQNQAFLLWISWQALMYTNWYTLLTYYYSCIRIKKHFPHRPMKKETSVDTFTLWIFKPLNYFIYKTFSKAWKDFRFFIYKFCSFVYSKLAVYTRTHTLLTDYSHHHSPQFSPHIIQIQPPSSCLPDIECNPIKTLLLWLSHSSTSLLTQLGELMRGLNWLIGLFGLETRGSCFVLIRGWGKLCSNSSHKIHRHIYISHLTVYTSS